MREAGNSEERPERPQRQQQAGEVQQEERVDWREIFKQEQPPSPEPERAQPTFEERPKPVSFEPINQREEVSGVVDRQQELHDRYEGLKNKRNDRILAARNEIGSSTDKERSSSKLDLELNRLSNKEAMKAIVFAEVLGKPRGKNPHQSFMQSRRMR